MTRVVLVAMGVPSLVPSTCHRGPGLRAAHFAVALAEQGHEVLLLCVLGDDETVPTIPASMGEDWTGWLTIEFTTEKELLGRPLRARMEGFDPQALVGVTVYAAALAVRLQLGVPLWADVFGDLMAEAQAKATRVGSDWSLVHFWTLLRGVLEGADRFSAVSGAQAHALIGQLGLAGRLSQRTAGEALVATIPCAAPHGEVRRGDSEADFRPKARANLGLSDEDVVLLASGGVNTWFDVETFCLGVRAAMDAEPRLRLVLTGGEIAGHDERSYAQLLAGLVGVHSARVRDLGWVDSSQLPSVYAAADLALHIERPLYERTLGAENRVVEWLAHGLPCVTTGQSEAGRELVARGLARGCRVGDADGLARVLREQLRAEAAAWRADAGRRGREWAQWERDVAATAAPLLAWVAAPVFAGDRDGARLIRLGLLSHPETSVEMLEAYVAELPLAEVLRRGVRWFARRLWNFICGAANLVKPRLSRKGTPRSRFRASGRRW